MIGGPKLRRPVASDMSSLLDALGFDAEFDAKVSGDPVAHTLHRLRISYQSGSLPITAEAFARLEAEVLSHFSSVFYTPEGRVERTVTVAALRLEQTDGNTLMHAATWNAFDGLKLVHGLPGGKIGATTNPEDYVHDLIGNQLCWLPYETCFTGSKKEEYVKDSPEFGIPTRYSKTVFYAYEGTEAPTSHFKLNQRTNAKPLVYQLSTQSEQVEAPTTSQGRLTRAQIKARSQADLAGKDSTEPSPFKDVPMIAVIYDFENVGLYCWMPPQLFDVRDTPAFKAQMAEWTKFGMSKLESIMKDHGVLKFRAQCRTDRNRILGVQTPDVDEPPEGYKDSYNGKSYNGKIDLMDDVTMKRLRQSLFSHDSYQSAANSRRQSGQS